MLEAVYHPDRIVHPLKRAKEDRGKDTWEQITMDEAYELCIQMVKDTTEKYGAKSICTGAGTGRNATWQSNVLGQGAVRHAERQLRHARRQLLLHAAHAGHERRLGRHVHRRLRRSSNEARFDHPEYRRPDLFMIWGNNPLRANADGFFGHWIIDCMRRGSELFVVASCR